MAASDGPKPPLGILCGGGSLPREVAAAVIAQGRGARLFLIRGEADPAGEAFPHDWIKRGELGKLFRESRRNGVRDLLVIGGIKARRLPKLSECDFTGILHVIRHIGMMTRGDDSVLRRVARLLEAGGLTLVGIADAAPSLLVSVGAQGAIRPGAAATDDIAFGTSEARALGAQDIGQAVVVCAGAVLAREDRRGTDAMLADLADGRAMGGVLIKSVKPQQDRRLDLPAIGPETVRRAVTAGLAGIAVEAGGALLAERAVTIAAADSAGIFIHGFAPPGT